MVEVCEKIQKPPSDHRSILRKLFPSSNSAASSKCKPSSKPFNPSDDCVFVSEQRRKKKAARKSPTRVKNTCVTLMVIEDIQKGVPRGSYKASLIEDGMSMTILLNREMSSDQVGEIITKALVSKNIPYYTLLECNGVKLSPSVEQHPSGSTVIKLAQKRRGNTIYVLQKHHGDSETEV